MTYLFEEINKLNNSDKLQSFNKKKHSKKSFKRFFSELYPNYIECISDIIIYVLIVCNILTILFFTIVKDVEGEIVKQQINNLLDDIFINIKNPNYNSNINHRNQLLNDKNDKKSDNNLINQNFSINDIKIFFKKKMEEIKIDEETENKIKENNNKILKISLFTLLIINILCIIILFVLWKINNYDYIYYLKKI
jgi:hypothetical protein